MEEKLTEEKLQEIEKYCDNDFINHPYTTVYEALLVIKKLCEEIRRLQKLYP